MIVGITENEKVKTLTSNEFITAQLTGSDCCVVFASVGKANTRFSVHSDISLVLGSSLMALPNDSYETPYVRVSYMFVIIPTLPGSLSDVVCTTP